MSRARSLPAPAKTCATCGRRMEYRKRWRTVWAEVKYCSDACRRSRRDNRDGELEARLLHLLATRAHRATLCPSEVARSVDPEGWPALMEPVRRAGRRLAAEGRVVFRQRGLIVDPSTARGPVRLGRGPRWQPAPPRA